MLSALLSAAYASLIISNAMRIQLQPISVTDRRDSGGSVPSQCLVKEQSSFKTTAVQTRRPVPHAQTLIDQISSYGFLI